MRIITIIQARTGSSRLPRKVLKPLGDVDVLTYSVKRCQAIEGIDEVIVATSNAPADNAIVNWCKARNVPVCRGSEQDVLDRYVQCAKKYQPDYVMRVTSDCPFVDYELATDMVQFIQEHPVEVVDVVGEMPRGLAVEIISYDALKRIHKVSSASRHREHVTYYAYEYRDQFTRASFNVPDNRFAPQFRITLDTQEDYEMLSEIASHFNFPLISSVQVIDFLKENPKIATINAHIEQKPVV